MPLNDCEIERRCLGDRPMVKPFIAENISEVGGKSGEKLRVISFGLSSFGLDIRVGRTFKLFSAAHGAVEVDPKNFDERALVTRTVDEHGYVLIPPHSYALAESIEEFDIPRDVVTLCLGKSTYARCGIIVNVTPFEPEWRGTATLEIANTNPLPARVYASEGLAQVIFLDGEPCRQSYADKRGKYMDQRGVVPPKMIQY